MQDEEEIEEPMIIIEEDEKVQNAPREPLNVGVIRLAEPIPTGNGGYV